MKITVLPSTKPGKWSIGLAIGVFLFYFLSRLIVVLGNQRGGEEFFSNLFIAIPVLLAGLSGVAAFFTGIVGVVKDKERSILVILAILFGFLVLMFGLGEFVSPH